MEKLYLTERIDIIGTHENRSKFAQLLVDYGKNQAETGGPMQQIGTWILIGMTGRWQRVLGLWEWADGWEGFSASVDQTMIQPPAALAGLYKGVDKLRSGGENFLLRPGPGCPEQADLLGRGVKGSLMSYETVRVEPGAEEEYIEAMRKEWLPVAERHGYALLGNYIAAQQDGLVFTSWALERDSLVRLKNSPEAQAWRKSARQWTRSWQEELFISAPGSPVAGPETSRRF